MLTDKLGKERNIKKKIKIKFAPAVVTSSAQVLVFSVL